MIYVYLKNVHNAKWINKKGFQKLNNEHMSNTNANMLPCWEGRHVIRIVYWPRTLNIYGI